MYIESLQRAKKGKGKKGNKNYVGRERKSVLLEIFRPLFLSGFEIEFSWIFPTKLVPPLPQKRLEI